MADTLDEQDAIGAATTMTLLIAAYGLDIVLLLLQCLRPVHLILVPFRFERVERWALAYLSYS